MDIIYNTFGNDVYTLRCRCPKCNAEHVRPYGELTFYCNKCGAHLRCEAFSEEEIDAAIEEHKLDDFEDL